MITMISTISVVGVIYWRYSLSVMHGRSLFQEICCIYEHRIYRVNLSRDLTPPSHVLSNDMCSNGVGAYLPRYGNFATGSPFFEQTLDDTFVWYNPQQRLRILSSIRVRILAVLYTFVTTSRHLSKTAAPR